MLESPFHPYDNLLICLFHRLRLHNEGEPHDILRSWIKRVKEERDTVVTTNYDNVIEWTLAFIGTGEYPREGYDALSRDALHWIDYGIPQEWQVSRPDVDRWATPPNRCLPLLKLHGSIGWSHCRSCNLYSLDEIFDYAAEHAITSFGSCVNCRESKNRVPVLVPPVVEKRYDDRAIEQVWVRAEKELREAREIIFSGFSLNPVDLRVRELLMANRRPDRVVLVSPNPGPLESRYREIYGDLVEARRQSWKEYLLDQFGTELGRGASSGVG